MRSFPGVISIGLFIVIFSCHMNERKKTDVEQAMEKYDHDIMSMNLDSISSDFTVDGDLGSIAHGRDSIRKFLSKFASFKVLSQLSITDSIRIIHDTAVQTGKYRQTVVVAPKDTLTVKGFFKTKWIRQKDQRGWKIKLIETHPAK